MIQRVQEGLCCEYILVRGHKRKLLKSGFLKFPDYNRVDFLCVNHNRHLQLYTNLRPTTTRSWVASRIRRTPVFLAAILILPTTLPRFLCATKLGCHSVTTDIQEASPLLDSLNVRPTFLQKIHLPTRLWDTHCLHELLDTFTPPTNPDAPRPRSKARCTFTLAH